MSQKIGLNPSNEIFAQHFANYLQALSYDISQDKSVQMSPEKTPFPNWEIVINPSIYDAETILVWTAQFSSVNDNLFNIKIKKHAKNIFLLVNSNPRFPFLNQIRQRSKQVWGKTPTVEFEGLPTPMPSLQNYSICLHWHLCQIIKKKNEQNSSLKINAIAVCEKLGFSLPALLYQLHQQQTTPHLLPCPETLINNPNQIFHLALTITNKSEYDYLALCLMFINTSSIWTPQETLCFCTMIEWLLAKEDVNYFLLKKFNKVIYIQALYSLSLPKGEKLLSSLISWTSNQIEHESSILLSAIILRFATDMIDDENQKKRYIKRLIALEKEMTPEEIEIAGMKTFKYIGQLRQNLEGILHNS